MPLLTGSLFGINGNTGILCCWSEAHPGAPQRCAAWALPSSTAIVSSRIACQDVNVINPLPFEATVRQGEQKAQ